jgi:hypothetical protein
MRLGYWLTLLVYVAVFSLTGCASGDRFGSNGPVDDHFPGYDDGCESDIECYDEDPSTYDFCDSSGECEHLVIMDGDPSGGDPLCDFETAVAHDALVSVDVPGVDGELSHATPLGQGRLLQLSFRDPARVRVRPTGKDEDGLMLVLLRDCANAAVNRIAWGPSIYSSEVDGDDYYLAVFAEEPRTVELDIHFLEVTSCDDAGNLETGEVTGTTDGYADDFVGSCVPTNGLGEHRGDRVYTFFVPEGQLWDVQIDLFTGDNVPNHYLYLRKGCAGPDTIEIDCANEFAVSDLLDASQDEKFMRVRGEDLDSGAYYVFVDSLPFEDYSLGEYHFEIEFQGVGPR